MLCLNYHQHVQRSTAFVCGYVGMRVDQCRQGFYSIFTAAREVIDYAMVYQQKYVCACK